MAPQVIFITLCLRKQPKNRFVLGKKTHLLHFKTNDTEKTIILYLNNWETIQMPFGLLPDMEILVQNVLPQKQKYFKSTILTNFEILNYVPKIPFETANL